MSFPLSLNVITYPLSRFSFLPPFSFVCEGLEGVLGQSRGLVSAAGILEQDFGWMHTSMPSNYLQAVQELPFLR